MILQESKYSNIVGVFPNAVLIDASGPGLTDGSELVALNQNDGFEPFQQALMDYAAGGVNAPAGTVGVPNGVSEATGVSQMLDAIQKGNAVGPGIGVRWTKEDDPSTTGDRVLILSGQGVLRSVYPDLDTAVYVGDVANATAEFYYHADDSAGTSRNIAGVYLILGRQPIYVSKTYLGDGTDFTVSAPLDPTWVTSSKTYAVLTISESFPVIEFWINGRMDNASISSYFLRMSSTTFKSNPSPPSDLDWPITLSLNTTSISLASSYGLQGTGDIILGFGTSFNNRITCHGRVPLETLPSWATEPEYQIGITY